MVRRDKNRRASANSEAAGGSPGRPTPNATNSQGRNTFFDDFETFYYTGHFADEPSFEQDLWIDELAPEPYEPPSNSELDYLEAAYQPPTEVSEAAHVEQDPAPGIRRVNISALVQPAIEEEPPSPPNEDLSKEPIEDKAEETSQWHAEQAATSPDREVYEPVEIPEQVDVEIPKVERPMIRRIAAAPATSATPATPTTPAVPPTCAAPPAKVSAEPLWNESFVDFSEPEEDETQYTEHIHIVPSLGKSTVQEGDHVPASEKSTASDSGYESEELIAADTTTPSNKTLPQATERIYFPAGFSPERTPIAEEGVVQEGAFVAKAKDPSDPKAEAEDKINLENTDAIEIRRVLSLAEAVVLEQSLRAQNPLADLSTTEIETILLDEIGEESIGDKDKEEDKDEEAPTPWHARIPVNLDLQGSLNRAGEAIKPTKDNFNRWISRPFRPRALPSNFDTFSEPRKRSILQVGRLEAEMRGLVLSSAVAYAILWFIWLLLPANFLGILKNQVSGQLVYQLLQAGMVLLAPLMLFAKYHPFPMGRIFGPVMPSGSQSFISALIGLPLGVLVISLQNLSTSVLPNIYSSNLNRYMFMPQSLRPGSTVILWILHILLPSFLEELFFRGNLFTGLMRLGHRRAAFILPSLLYAFLFKDPLIFIPFLVGIALSWVRYRSASLFGSMVAHLSFAATIFFLYQNVPAFVRTMPLSSTAGQASLYASVVAAVVSAVTLVSLLAFVATLQSSEQMNEYSHIKASNRSLLQLRELRIGMLIFVLIYFLNLGLF